MKATVAVAATGIVAPRISRAQSASVLNFVPQSDLTLLDPVQTTGLVTRNHGIMVFDTLYGMDEGYTPHPQMVDGHTIEKDGLRWTLTLRDGLKFHDGEPVLARDAVASIKRWWQRDPFGLDLQAATAELSAPTDKTIQFDLKRPFPLLAHALGKPSGICPIMPERLAATPPTQQVTEMVGSGPFRFLASERVIGSQTVYERFAGYVPRSGSVTSYMSGPKIVNVDRVVWHTIPDAATAAAALQAGEIDWWEEPTPDLIEMLSGYDGLTVEVKNTAGALGMIRFNQLQPPFDNPAIRRALLPAIQQATYMTAVMGRNNAYWKDNVGFYLPGTPYVTDEGMGVFAGAPNYDKVKADLAAAGYKGEKVVFVVPTDLHALNSMSLVVNDMFQKVGINVDYQASDWGTVLQRIASQKPVAEGGWNVWCNYIPGALAISPATNSYARGTGKSAPFGWPTSAKIEELRANFLSSADPAEQKRLAAAIQAQAFEDVPYIPLGYFSQPTAYSSAVSGILSGSPVFYNVKKS